MPANTPPGLDAIATHTAADPGLAANTSAEDIAGGVDAALLMNRVIEEVLAATGVNNDGRITADDMRAISSYVRANPELYDRFVEGHGDDEGNVETGFHLVQGDGGTLKFQGRKFIDTVADAIYHFGFRIVDGRFENEDGNANERVEDVAGWLNYYLNGVNVVYGSADGETLHSGDYSALLSDAASELFMAGAGNDRVWAGDGDDEVRAGSGNDTAGGGSGDDLMFGASGNDKLWGETGNDTLDGGTGHDTLGGGNGDDSLIGGGGHDKLWGEDGNDTIDGGRGHDRLGGGDGDDQLVGGAGKDVLSGEAGDDMLDGGKGRDKIWAGSGDDSIFGGDGADTIGGDNGNDVIHGGRGRDKVWGGEGNDAIRGAGGNDHLVGDGGNDTIDGGAGSDKVVGGDGDDILIGGTGADELVDWDSGDTDTFVFAVGDMGLGNDRDVIKGFTLGADTIDLTDFGATFVERFTGTGSEVRIEDRLVLIDIDGDGAADASIEVKWVNGLSADDLSL